MSIRAFLLNWLGVVNVPEDQMLRIEHPRFEVQWYNTMKCMEIGAVLGYAYAMRVPVMRYFGRAMPPTTTTTTTAMSRVDASRSILRMSRAGMLGGLFASIPVGVVYSYQQRLTNDASYYRKALELRHNKKQLNLDRGSILVGLGSGAFYKSMFGLPLSLGFAQGMALGTIGVAIFNNFDWLYRKKEDVKDKVKDVKDNVKDTNAFEKLSGKVQEQAENAKDSLRKVSHQAQERAEDAKGSLKKVAGETKDAFKKASEEGKDSLKKATSKAQDYAQELKTSANELKNKAKETVQNEYKKIEHRAD